MCVVYIISNIYSKCGDNPKHGYLEKQLFSAVRRFCLQISEK